MFHRQVVKGTVYHSYLCNTCRAKDRKRNYVYKPVTCPEKSRKLKESSNRSAKKYRQEALNYKKKLMDCIGQTICKTCKYSDIRGLAFHHRDASEKSFSIARGLSRRMRFERLLEEAKKCDVLCNNCHVILHTNSQSKRALRDAKRKEQLLNDTNQTSCKHCNVSNAKCLTFHHRDRQEKKFEIPIGLHRYSYQTILSEARKCDVLCLNCHMILHSEERTSLYRLG